MQSVKSRLKKILICFSLFALLSSFSPPKIWARDTVDKIVATVGDGIDTELITYSDLLWQLALIPNASLSPPTSEELNRALQILINQRLFALEAERVPRAAPNQEDIKKEINRVLALFPSAADFEKRLRLVGFDSVNDDNFERMMAQRVSIEKYLEFRFRSFVVITPQDEANFYRNVFTPDFRRKNPGLLMPPLEEVRSRINQILTEQKIAADIEKFLDDAKSRSEIVVLSEV
jgi:hypothetical protein